MITTNDISVPQFLTLYAAILEDGTKKYIPGVWGALTHKELATPRLGFLHATVDGESTFNRITTELKALVKKYQGQTVVWPDSGETAGLRILQALGYLKSERFLFEPTDKFVVTPGFMNRKYL